MKISQAIKMLEKMKEKEGDVEVETDCEHCGKSTVPTIVVPGVPTVVLKTSK